MSKSKLDHLLHYLKLVEKEREQIAESLKPLDMGAKEFIDDWSKKSFKNLPQTIKDFWLELFPSILEGMTWEGALDYQGTMTGPRLKFPEEVLIPQISSAKICFKKINKDWRAIIEGVERLIKFDLCFLKETVEIGRVEIDNRKLSKIDDNFIKNSDRFLILKKEKDIKK